MNLQVWPFLVSRNRYLGYQTVVAPSFMVEANITGLLAHQVGGEPSDYPQYLELPKTKVGDLSAIYRIVRAADENMVFRDESGRPILWIEGVVLRELAQHIAFSDDVLQEAHRRVESEYQQFWKQTSEGPVRRSTPFSIDIDSNHIASPKDQLSWPGNSPTSATSTEAIAPQELSTEPPLARSWLWYMAITLSVLLIASLLLSGFLFMRNRQLRSQVQDLQATIQALQTATVQPSFGSSATPTPQNQSSRVVQ
jgi:hypothetical protein